MVPAGNLVLRAYASADAAQILELVTTNRERLQQSFASTINTVSCSDGAAAFIQAKTEQWHAATMFCYGIWHRASQKLVGQLNVKNIAWEVPSAELSYFIDAGASRQGYAAVAITSILELAMRQLAFKRIYLRVITSNRPSVLLAKKLGFQHEGLHRNEFVCGFGKLHGVHYFSITDTDLKQSIAAVR